MTDSEIQQQQVVTYSAAFRVDIPGCGGKEEQLAGRFGSFELFRKGAEQVGRRGRGFGVHGTHVSGCGAVCQVLSCPSSLGLGVMLEYLPEG